MIIQIDMGEFKKRISGYDSSIENVDSKAHKSTPQKRYEGFHDHFIKGIHCFGHLKLLCLRIRVFKHL